MQPNNHTASCCVSRGPGERKHTAHRSRTEAKVQMEPILANPVGRKAGCRVHVNSLTIRHSNCAIAVLVHERKSHHPRRHAVRPTYEIMRVSDTHAVPARLNTGCFKSYRHGRHCSSATACCRLARSCDDTCTMTRYAHHGVLRNSALAFSV